MSCTAARTWITKATHQPATAPIKGPAGFICHSFSTPASGDKLQYSGICMHPPHNTPFIEWAPEANLSLEVPTNCAFACASSGMTPERVSSISRFARPAR